MSISVFWPSTRAWGSWRSTEWTTSRRAPSAATESLCTGKKGKTGQGNLQGESKYFMWAKSRNFSLEPGFTLPWFLKNWRLREKWIFLQAQLRLNFHSSFSFLSLINTSCTEMHAALLHRYLKGAACGLLLCFHLTDPSTCYLWLLLIEIDVVTTLVLIIKWCSQKNWLEWWGFRPPSPVTDSLPPVFWEQAWVFPAQDAKDQTFSKHAEKRVWGSSFTCTAAFCFGNQEIQIQVPVIQVGLQFSCSLSWQT